MNIRRPLLAALATIGVAAGIALTGPTAIAAPTTPSNCTFSKATGQTTCNTTTTLSSTSVNLTGVTQGSVTDGSVAAAFCNIAAPFTDGYGVRDGATLTKATTQSTTTVYQGTSTGNGNKPVRVTPNGAPTTTITVAAGVFECTVGGFGGSYEAFYYPGNSVLVP